MRLSVWAEERGAPLPNICRSSTLRSPQGPADGESGPGYEHHPQHLQPDPEVPRPADRTALGQPPGGGGAPQLHRHAAVLQHLQVLLPLSVQR